MVHWLHVRKLISSNEGDTEAARVIGELALLLSAREDDATATMGIPGGEDGNVVTLRRSSFDGA